MIRSGAPALFSRAAPSPDVEHPSSRSPRRERSERFTARIEALLLAHRPGRALLEIIDGTLEGDALRAASATAFDSFLAAIPLLALAEWVFALLGSLWR